MGWKGRLCSTWQMQIFNRKKSVKIHYFSLFCVFFVDVCFVLFSVVYFVVFSFIFIIVSALQMAESPKRNIRVRGLYCVAAWKLGVKVTHSLLGLQVDKTHAGSFKYVDFLQKFYGAGSPTRLRPVR